MSLMRMMMPHLGPRTVRRGWHDEAGIALMSVILLSVVALLLTGALSAVILTGIRGTSFARSAEIGRSVAEAGLNATVFRIEAGTNPTAASTPIGLETYLTTSLGTANMGSPRAGTAHFTGTLANGSYAVALTDPSAGDNMFTLTSVGTDQASGRSKTLVAVVRGESVNALNYAMFGNKIEFHNHNKENYGVTLNTSMFSNGNIQIDKGVSIIGTAQAVNRISPNTGPAQSFPLIGDTVLSPAGQQGDPNPNTSVPTAQVVQVVPAPPIQAFPTFDFFAAKAAADAAGRTLTPAQLTTLITNAKAFGATGPMTPAVGASVALPLPQTSYPAGITALNVPIRVIRYNHPANGPSLRNIAVPNGANPNRFVPFASWDGTNPPAFAVQLYEIQFLKKTNGTPYGTDNVLYVTGAVEFSESQQSTPTMFQIQGSLVVNGSVKINAPIEILAWHNRTGVKVAAAGGTLYTPIATTQAEEDAVTGTPPVPTHDLIYSNWPALAANGAIKVADSIPNWGGPVHIEGPIYTVAESHFHKSHLSESSYSVGGEIADTIHNCQFFSFAYDPQALNTLGLYNKAAGRVKLAVIRLEEH
jgi:hypothetical protein